MRNINRVILAGNMTADPDFRHLPSNTPVASFGLALNRVWRNREGELQEETSFVDCEAFGRQAEVLHQYGRKGRGLFVEGRLRQDRWEDREGHNRTKMRIVVERLQFTDSRGSGEGEQRETADTAGPARVAVSQGELEEQLPF